MHIWLQSFYMSKRCLIFILLFYVFENLHAQSTYSKSILGPESVYPYDMIITGNNEYIVATSNPEMFNSTNLCLSKLNNHGTLLWANSYPCTGQQLPIVRMAATKAKGFVAISRAMSGAFILFKCDSNGNILWQKLITYTSQNDRTDPGTICVTNDESIYTTHGWDDYVNGESINGVYIQKFDKNGNQQWVKFFHPDNKDDEFENYDGLTATSDNGVVLAATSFFRIQSKYYSLLYKFTSEGEPEWKYVAEENGYNYTFSQVVKCDDKAVLHILYAPASQHYVYVTFDPASGLSKGYDIANSIFSLQSYLKNNDVNIFKDVAFPQGDLEEFFMGFTKNWDLITAGLDFYDSGSRWKVRINKFDSIGRICPDYRKPKTDYPAKPVMFKFRKLPLQLSEVPGIISITDANISVENIDRIKTICSGEPNNFNTSSIEQDNVKIDATNFTLIPNPANTNVNIILNSDAACTSKIDIIDLNGKILKSINTFLIKGSNQVNVDVSFLSKGAYFVRVQNSGKIESQKLVVQ
jgi:type IX secretion system substrate protein